MKKSILIAGSVLSLFILVSLSYQPIIAEKQVIELKAEITNVEEEDCGCDKLNNDYPKILCFSLSIMYFTLIYVVLFIDMLWLNQVFEELFSNLQDRVLNIYYYGKDINCPFADLFHP